jgi:hypothetical protein
MRRALPPRGCKLNFWQSASLMKTNLGDRHKDGSSIDVSLSVSIANAKRDSLSCSLVKSTPGGCAAIRI